LGTFIAKHVIILRKWFVHSGLNRAIGMVNQIHIQQTARRQSTVVYGHNWKRLWVASAIAGGELFVCRHKPNKGD